MLLLSYPSIESIYFNQKNLNEKFESGTAIKQHIDNSFKIKDLSKLTKNCLEIIKNLTSHDFKITDVDDFS